MSARFFHALATGAILFAALSRMTLASPPDFGRSAERESLSVAALVAAVLARNASLKALAAAAEAAEYRIDPAGALDDPRLAYGIAPNTLGGRFRQGQLEISQPLPWPGKLALREEAARSEARAVGEDVEALRLRVAAAAKALFAEWAYVHRLLAINREHQALLLELKNVAETRFAVGRARQQDVLQAEVEHARLETEAATLEQQRHEVRARINALLQRPPRAALPPPAGLPEPVQPPPLQRLRRFALASHPTLARIRARVDAAIAERGLAQKNYYPDFRVSAGYNSLWDQSDKRWTVGLSINIPFDFGNKRDAQLGAARAEIRRFNWQLSDREAQLMAELASSRAGVVETVRVIDIYRERLLPLAQDNLAAALADYRAGDGQFLNVIDAERQRLRTEGGVARARADYLRRLAALERWSNRSLGVDTAAADVRQSPDELTVGGSAAGAEVNANE